MSVRVKSKPPRPPPPIRRKREKGGEFEMEDIVDTNEKDKQYFFKNTSNIGEIFGVDIILCCGT